MMDSANRFLVSGWDDDLEDIDVEKKPHETPSKEILWAAENGNLEVIKGLIEQDSSLVHSTDTDGYTPLHRACYGDYTEIVSYLIQHGANISAKTQFLWEPLHSCCQWNHFKCAKILIDAGANVNALTEGNQTPLHIAASHGASYKMVQLLLMHPYIKVDLVNNNHDTPYDIAKRSSKFYKIFEMADPLFKGVE